MSFDDMPDRGELMLPGAKEYAARILAESKAVVANSRCILDVSYGNDFFQKLDIFLPNDLALTDLPVLLFLHGGAWRHGFKEWMGFMAPNFNALPAIFVSANYRLAPETKHPGQLNDCWDAIAWIYHRIDDHGGDPNKIYLGGHSAGGHLAALTALKLDYAAKRDLPRDVIKACFPLSPPLNLRLDEMEPGGRREKVVKLLLARDSDDRDASPIDSVAGNKTPFFIAWGENDLPEIAIQTPAVVEALEREQCVVDWHRFGGTGHSQTNENCRDIMNPWVRKVRAWMKNPPEYLPEIA
ncbi:MAG: alpha/beta hydrolase [Alphaproteobacteria bacterium]|nr:alpha/beta hydrolase [Alphaproteobacteria bacterium]